MYSRGHEHGTRRQHHTASDWYASIESATIAALDASWPSQIPTHQEVLSDTTANDVMQTANTATPMPTMRIEQ